MLLFGPLKLKGREWGQETLGLLQRLRYVVDIPDVVFKSSVWMLQEDLNLKFTLNFILNYNYTFQRMKEIS